MGKAKESNIHIMDPGLFKVLWNEFILVATLLLIGQQFLQVGGAITSLDVPMYIPHGDMAIMQCTFDDSIADLRNFIWSSSLKTVTDRSQAAQLLAYNVITKTWSGPAMGRMEAILNETGRFSTLTINEVNVTLDDNRYWCIVQVSSGSDDRNADTEVTVLNTTATNLLGFINDEGKEVDAGKSLALKNGAYTFKCRVIGAKPAPTITWTLDVPNATVPVQTDDENGLLFNSTSMLSVTIDDTFKGKNLTCKATVPAFKTGVSDTVTITSIGPSPSPVGAIVGGVFGGIVIIIGFVGGGYYCLVYKKKN